MLKPDVVFFGENVPRERAAAVREALAKADAMLVVGSSLMVYSGYRFVEDAVLSLKVELEVGEALKTLAKRV
jgi:NAD-dependent SIR2 family protein deacetylase